MIPKAPRIMALALVALPLLNATSVYAETQTEQDPVAEAQAFLTSPTSLVAALATVETVTGGSVSGIEFQTGTGGQPDLILADVIMSDGSEKTVAVNPADGKVMKIADGGETDDDQSGGSEEDDGEMDDQDEG